MWRNVSRLYSCPFIFHLVLRVILTKHDLVLPTRRWCRDVPDRDCHYVSASRTISNRSLFVRTDSQYPRVFSPGRAKRNMQPDAVETDVTENVTHVVDTLCSGRCCFCRTKPGHSGLSFDGCANTDSPPINIVRPRGPRDERLSIQSRVYSDSTTRVISSNSPLSSSAPSSLATDHCL